MVILDGKQMGDKAQLHAHLKDKLALPDYYGANLDALNDCLGERRERELIVIEDSASFLEDCGVYGVRTLRVFTDNGIQVLLS